MGTWQTCLDRLEGELTAQQFNTWIRPLQAIEDNETLRILAPNQFVLDWVNNRFLDRINGILGDQKPGSATQRVSLEIAQTTLATPRPEQEDLRAL
ncbi:DnaA N-terminal domain-containing protein, partial [Kaarinaea lacus]